MDGKSANLVLTDPPYNVAFESSDGLKIKNDEMKAESFYEFLLAAFTNMAGVCEKGGSAYVFHADTEGLNFPQSVHRRRVQTLRLLHLGQRLSRPGTLTVPVAARTGALRVEAGCQAQVVR